MKNMKITDFGNNKIITCLLITTIGLCSIACNNDDDYVYPSVVSEFIDACTNSSGILTHIQTDDGVNLTILNKNKTEGLVKDSTYRYICRHAISHQDNNDKGTVIYALQQIPAPYPLPANVFNEIKTDPLKLESIWRAGNYLNMILQIKVQNGKHAFHFIQDSIVTTADNNKKLYLRLFHDAGNDIQAYTQKAYLSVPLTPYKTILRQGDTICFSINITDEGWKTWKKPF